MRSSSWVLLLAAAFAPLSGCGGFSNPLDEITPYTIASPSPQPSLAPPLPTDCVLGYEDNCFRARTISQADIRAIKDDYHAAAALFPLYRGKLQAELGPAFAGISDEGLALAFAVDVAYEAMPYRSDGSDWDPPLSRDSPADMLADGTGLLCDEYVTLAIELFYAIDPQDASSTVRITPIGWRTDSPLGNHAEAFVTGAGVPMLLDPTWGLVARGDLDTLFLGGQVKPKSVAT
ncbi:MAG TPA: hypothetical protein VMV18_01720, partial [bacterium]|nr:hypothetical protein [bacterium]